MGTQERLSPGLALFLLAQVFHIFSHKVLGLARHAPLQRSSVVSASRGVSLRSLVSFFLSIVQRLIDTLGAALIHPNPTTYIHQMLKQTDSSKNLLSLGSGGSSNAYMVRGTTHRTTLEIDPRPGTHLHGLTSLHLRPADLKDSGATHSSLPSYDSGAQTTRLSGSSSKFHKRYAPR